MRRYGVRNNGKRKIWFFQRASLQFGTDQSLPRLAKNSLSQEDANSENASILQQMAHTKIGTLSRHACLQRWTVLFHFQKRNGSAARTQDESKSVDLLHAHFVYKFFKGQCSSVVNEGLPCFDLDVGQFGKKRFLRYSFWRAHGAANVGGSNATLRNKTLTFHISIYIQILILQSFIVAHTTNRRRGCKCPKVRTGIKQYQKIQKVFIIVLVYWSILHLYMFTRIDLALFELPNVMCKSHKKPSDPVRAKEVTCRQLGRRVCRQASNVGSRVPKHHVSTRCFWGREQRIWGRCFWGREQRIWGFMLVHITLKPEAFYGILIISDILRCSMTKSSFLNQTKLHLRVLFCILSEQKPPPFVDTVQEKIPIETTLCS